MNNRVVSSALATAALLAAGLADEPRDVPNAVK
jgi:hypothetical protein